MPLLYRIHRRFLPNMTTSTILEGLPSHCVCDRYILQDFQPVIALFSWGVSLRSHDPLAAFGLSNQSVDIKGFQDDFEDFKRGELRFLAPRF